MVMCHPCPRVPRLPHDFSLRLDPTFGPLGDPAPFRHAAVLATILPEATAGDGLRLLLIQRAAGLRHHPGQLAFPGGKPEPGDADLVATALREAWEEVALPSGQVTILGRLSPVPVPTGYVIVPYVGLVAGAYEPRHDIGEVDSVLTPAIRHLTAPDVYRFAGEREWQGQNYELHEFQIHQPPLWGATARIVYDLLGRMDLAPARPLARSPLSPLQK
jgi:8-oxo-dGTP pyrophosphatase MutT (NUDIX family)